MFGLSLPHLLLLLIVVVLLFGAGGRIPRIADDMAKGIKAFRNGMRDEEKPEEKRELGKDAPLDPPPTSKP